MESSPTNFGARLRGLIEGKGITVAQFAEQYGIGESQAFNWLKRDEPPLAKHWSKLADFFGVSRSYIASGTPEKMEYPTPDFPRGVVEEQVKSGYFRKAGSPHGGKTSEDFSPSPPVMLDPRFQPRAEPTKQMCLDYIAEYLTRAEQEPGGIGYSWVKLQKNFPLDEFEPKTKAPP